MFILRLTELLGLQAQAVEVGFDDGEQLRVHRRVPADCQLLKIFFRKLQIFSPGEHHGAPVHPVLHSATVLS